MMPSKFGIKKVIRNVLSLILITLMVSTTNVSQAFINKFPVPVINSKNGFLPSQQYSATASIGDSKLEVNESVVWRGIYVYLLDQGAGPTSECGDTKGELLNIITVETGPSDALKLLPQTISWVNPANSGGRTICVYATHNIMIGGDYVNFDSPAAYATIQNISTPKPSPTPTNSILVSPSPTISPSKTTSALAEPSGSKPSVSGTPLEGAKFKVSVKSWNMNGNKFETRSVYIKLCNDAQCKDVVNSYPVIETGTLNFDAAKTLTMSKIVGKEGQYIKVIDSVSYPAPATSESGEDILIELSSSTKKIEKKASNSPTPSPSFSQTLNATEDNVNDDQNSNNLDKENSTTELKEQNSLLSSNLVITVLGILSLIVLITVVILVKRKNK
jgi:hypothetical protein